MSMFNEQCVKLVLCGLAASTRNVLLSLLDQYITLLNVEKTRLQALLLEASILSGGASVLNDIVQQQIGLVRSGLNYIPVSAIETCAGLGDFNVTVNGTINTVLAEADKIATDLARYISFGDELNAQVNKIEDAIEVYSHVQITLRACGEEATT